jgi:flagellar hook-associated protein 2
LLTKSDNANKENTSYQTQLAKLQTRMDALLARYQKQFAAMDSMVGSTNSQKTSLKSTFDGMMATYTNK